MLVSRQNDEYTAYRYVPPSLLPWEVDLLCSGKINSAETLFYAIYLRLRFWNQEHRLKLIYVDDPISGTIDTHRHRSMHPGSSGNGNPISNGNRNGSGDLVIVGNGNGNGRDEGENRDRGEVKEEDTEYSHVHG